MKLLSIVLSLLLLTGCAAVAPTPAAPQATPDTTVEQPAAPAAQTTVDTVVNPPTAEEPLTKEAAEAIALAHAGFAADQVTGLHTNYEIDDGVPRFEVEFHQGRMEYDYEIHAETGEILSFSMDD